MSSTITSCIEEEQPISRTYQYRKVMKPMLERKRRARINRCLDELKELMSAALAADGENLTKLEKADVLELTVRHLHKLRERQALGLTSASSAAAASAAATYADKFRAGFTHCAAEVSRYLAQSTGLDVQVGQRLLGHLGRCVHSLEIAPAASISPAAAPAAAFSSPFSSAPLAAPHPHSPVYGGSTYTPPTSPTVMDAMRSRSGGGVVAHHQHVRQSSPMLSPVSSPALSVESSPESFHEYSAKCQLRADMFSPPATTSVVAGGVIDSKVWRPW